MASISGNIFRPLKSEKDTLAKAAAILDCWGMMIVGFDGEYGVKLRNAAHEVGKFAAIVESQLPIRSATGEEGGDDE